MLPRLSCALGLAACCLAPAAGVRLQGRQRDNRRELIFYPPGEEPDASKLPREDEEEPPPTRLITVSKNKVHFEDSFQQNYLLLQFALAVHARPVTFTPIDLLTDPVDLSFVPSWWDGFFDSVPRLYRKSVIQGPCEKWNVTRLQNEIRLGNQSVLFDRSKELCVHMKGDITNDIFHNKELAQIVKDQSNGRVPLLYASANLTQYARSVFEELGPSYNAALVIQGDRGSPECTDAEFVGQQMASLGQADRWLVVSTGDGGWWKSLKDPAFKLNYVNITQLTSLQSIQDSFSRYAVLKCLFGASDKLLDTYFDSGNGIGGCPKMLPWCTDHVKGGFRCKPLTQKQHTVKTLCNYGQ